MSKTAIEYLDETKTLLQEKGWIRGSYFNGQEYCIVGALRHVGYDNVMEPYLDDEWLKARRCLDTTASTYDTLAISAMHYNDNIASSVEDIYKLIDDAKVCANG